LVVGKARDAMTGSSSQDWGHHAPYWPARLTETNFAFSR
jgi:hypothetical protein